MTSYFVAGASRGIGHELVLQLSSLPDTKIVFAGLRNLDSAPADLKSNPKITLVKLDVVHQADVDAAVATVKKQVSAIDVLVINAGAAISKPVIESSVQDLQYSLDLNTIAPYRLVLGFLPLIRAGHQKKIMAIGTGSGSFGLAQPFAKEGLPVGVYGVSKAALHFLFMLLGAELAAEGVLCVSVHPGLVDTDGAHGVIDQGPAGAEEKWKEMGVSMITTDESVKGLISVIKGMDAAQSGDFFAWNGQKLPF